MDWGPSAAGTGDAVQLQFMMSRMTRQEPSVGCQ